MKQKAVSLVILAAYVGWKTVKDADKGA